MEQLEKSLYYLIKIKHACINSRLLLRRRKRRSMFKIRRCCYRIELKIFGFCHATFKVLGENTLNEWCKPVSDEEYERLE